MVVALASVACACVAVLTWLFVVPRIRIDDPEAPDLSLLATGRSAVPVGLATLAASQTLWVIPGGQWWLWGAYLSFGVPLVSVDLLTTFLPARLTWLTLLAMCVATVPAAVAEPTILAPMAIGSAGVFVFLYLAWRFSGQLGFGDVRLGALIGAVSGTLGATGVAWALVAGTGLGAIHAIGHLLWARRDPSRPRHLPYGPALFTGPLIAAVLAATAG